MRRKIPHILPLNVPSQVSYVGEDDSEYFTEIHGRKINSMNLRYMLPSDADEIRVSTRSLIDISQRSYLSAQLFQRSELHHRMLQFLFGGRNYVGPVKDLLSSHRTQGPRKPKVLDLGTGSGNW